MDEYDLDNLPEHGTISERKGRKENSLDAPEGYGRQNARLSDFDSAQWTLAGPDRFQPSGRSFVALPAGTYRAETYEGQIYAVRQRVISDKLSVLPGGSNERIIAGIRTFWASKARYEKYGLCYKRGVIFFGPPGGGKSANIVLLCNELIEKHNGLVFLCQVPALLTRLLTDLRRIEPIRPLVVVLEDIDEIIDAHGEHDILALLDGETQIDNTVYLASTNYPSRLGARIINRPARFDERVKVGMPSSITRLAYLQVVTKDEPLTPEQERLWTADTEGMSIAHIRELMVAVRCLGQDYGDVIQRLRSMAIAPKEVDGIGKAIGLHTPSYVNGEASGPL